MKRPVSAGHSAPQSGWSYVEVLIAAVVLASALVPALEAMQTATLAAAVHGRVAIDRQRVAGRLEEVLAQPYAELEAAALAAGGPGAATGYSDAGGTPSRLLVYLSRYDADNADADDDPFTGTDDGLLWVRAEIEHGAGIALETLHRE